MRLLARLIVGVALVATACRPGPDFDIRDGGPLPDGPGIDGAVDGAVDGSVDGPLSDADRRDVRVEDDPCSPAVVCAECPMPWLLAAVEDLPGGAACGDRVWRWSIPASGIPCACAAYRPGTTQIRTVGFVPPSSVVVASPNDFVVGLDAESGETRWSGRLAGEPTDVFAIDGPDPRVGVAVRNTGTSDIREVRLYHPASPSTPTAYQTNDGMFPLGLGILSMTQSSSLSTRLRALRQNGDWAAIDVDPAALVRYDMPPHTPSRSGYNVLTVHAYYHDGFHRTVWAGRRSDLSGDPPRVFRVTTATDTVDNLLSNEQWCERQADGSAYDVACSFEHAVSDPADPNQILAICTHGGGRRIVRVAADNRCTDLIEDVGVFPSARVVRLSIGLPSFWP